MMLLTLDNLAHRYQCLPSHALEHGTTFDLRVMEVSSRWLQHQQQAQERGETPRTHQPRQEQLMEMIRRVREKND